MVGLMLLAPPWKYVQTMSSGERIPTRERTAGYALVFAPPSVKDHEAVREAFSVPQTRPDGKPVEIHESYYEVRLDATRLLVQCAAVAAVALGLVVFLHATRSSTKKIKPKWIGWMPSPLPPGETPALNPWAEARQIVGAIRVVAGQEMDYSMYMAFLADRVQLMLDRDEAPLAALRELEQNLDSEGLLARAPERFDKAGWVLVADNPLLRQRLSEMDVPGELPKRIVTDDPQAIKYVNETGIEAWTTALLNKPYDSWR